jgi:hypothetical protein
VLTSRFTLDAQSGCCSADMGELADLVGAVRLPEGAMQRVAGTTVAMDLLAPAPAGGRRAGTGPGMARPSQRLHPRRPGAGQRGLCAHPEWVLGELRSGHGQYGQDDLEVRPLDGTPWMPRLEAALAGVVEYANRSGLAWSSRPSPRPVPGEFSHLVVDDAQRGPHHVEGSFLTRASGGFAKVREGQTIAYSPPSGQASELSLLVQLRDTYFDLIDAQSASSNDAPWLADQARLNELYDRYAALYGPISRYTESSTGRYDDDGEPVVARRFPAMGGFKKDPALAVLYSLEHYDDETKTATKAAIFERRVLAPRQVAESSRDPRRRLGFVLGRTRQCGPRNRRPPARL